MKGPVTTKTLWTQVKLTKGQTVDFTFRRTGTKKALVSKSMERPEEEELSGRVSRGWRFRKNNIRVFKTEGLDT